MKNKGFTLIELLGVIILMSLVSVIIVPNVTKSIKKGALVADNQVTENIILAAKNWSSDNKEILPKNAQETYGVWITTLQNEGYIDKNIKLPSTKEDLENTCIEIRNIKSSDNGSSIYDYKVNKKCKSTLTACEIVLQGERVNGWYNGEVKVKVIHKNKNDIEKWGLSTNLLNAKEYFESTTEEISTTPITKTFKEETGEGGITYYGYVKNKDGQTAMCKKTIKNHSAPCVITTNIEPTDGWYNSGDNLVLTLTKNDAPIDSNTPNVSEFGLGVSEEDFSQGQNSMTAVTSGMYYGYFKTNSGEINTCTKDIKIDKIKPVCTSGVYSYDSAQDAYIIPVTGYTNQSVKVKGVCQDEGGSECVLKQDSLKSTPVKSGELNQNMDRDISPGEVCDNAGNCTTCPVARVQIDKNKQMCTIVANSNPNSNGWYNKAVTLTLQKDGSTITSSTPNVSEFGLSNTENSGKSHNSITATAKGTYYGYYKTSAGTTVKCSKLLNIDTTKPTCSKWTGESTSWTSNNRTIKVECTDGASGCKASSYTVKTFSSGTTQTAALSYNIEDKAGNKQTCSKTANVYVDKTAPTCDGKTGERTTWTNGNVTVGAKCKDSGSGCSSSSFTTALTADGKTETKSITIKDKAGNTANCKYTFNKYIDKTKPTCTFKAKLCSDTGSDSCNIDSGSNYTAGTWVKKAVITSATCSDSGSGCKNKSVTSVGQANDVTNSFQGTRSVAANGGVTITWTVYDNAGNFASCGAKKVNIDTKAPTCSITKSGTSGDHGWYKSKDVTVKLSKSDTGGSGIESYGLTKSSSAKYNSSTSDTQGNTTGTTWYGYVKDKVGNTGKCNSGKIKVDKTAPTCGDKVDENTTWTNGSVTVGIECSDTGGSECAAKKFTKEVSAENKVRKDLSITIKDNAGNTKACVKDYKVYIDKTAPTCGSCGVSNRSSCGATYYQYGSDNLSGIDSCRNRHCYDEQPRGVDADYSWARVCHNGSINGSFENKCSYNSSSGKLTHGLNAKDAKIVFQFKIKDKAGNEKVCSQCTKSYGYSGSNC